MIRLRQLGAKTIREVPFTARLTVAPPTYCKKTYECDSAASNPVRGMATPRLSPHGRNVAFIALNALWLMPLGGRPRKVDRFRTQALAFFGELTEGGESV